MQRKTKTSSYKHIGHLIYIYIYNIWSISRMCKHVPADKMYTVFHVQAVYKKAYKMVKSFTSL